MKKKAKSALVLLLALVVVVGLLTMTAGAATHTVAPGENLSSLAVKYLGDRTKWREIYEMNKDIIKDPNKIYVGQVLKVPGAEAEEPVEGPVAVTADVPLKETAVPESDPNYYVELFRTELYNYRLIRALPTAYDNAVWGEYFSYALQVVSMDEANLTDVNETVLKNIEALRHQLIQIKPFADCAWYIWGEDMATYQTEDKLAFTNTHFDNSDFKPFLVPYLQPDQSTVKGNVILVSGGGFESRANDTEAYLCQPLFYEKDYNVFILQRRVAPYAAEDSYLDLQRAIRYLRYNAEKYGIAKLDNLTAVGYSGGAMTIQGAVNNLYGDIQPTVYDAGYVADAVDAMNADLTVQGIIYGPDLAGTAVTENPNYPATFIAAGADDNLMGMIPNSFKLYSAIKDEKGVSAEFHVFAFNGHGFGPGNKGTGSVYWVDMIDPFIARAYRDASDDLAEVAASVPFGEIPAEFTRVQTYVGSAGFGTADVTCAINEDGSEFFLYFSKFGHDEVLAGWVDNGVVTVKYSKTGMFVAAAQDLYNSADQSAWQSR